MDAEDRLVTSPLLFGYRGGDGRLAFCDARQGKHFRLSSMRAAEVAMAFLDPRSPSDAAREGFDRDELEQAREAGILISADEFRSGELWERHGWSRPAYLLFGQMDIPYRDVSEQREGTASLASLRRSIVREQLEKDAYPEPQLLASDGRTIELPATVEPPSSLSALTDRRSARAFARRPPSVEQMAGVLYAGTQAFRVRAADRDSRDELGVLNSFYSWAHLVVVVQQVEGVAPGIYEYDWREHGLRPLAPPPREVDLVRCVQGMRWILGAGFVVFTVADLRSYAWLYRHSRAYLHVLMQVGELGQELLTAATALGLAGWLTPAVHESLSAALLGLTVNTPLEVLVMLKLGRPLPQTGRDRAASSSRATARSSNEPGGALTP